MSAAEARRPEPLDFNAVDVGHELPPFPLRLSRDHVRRYAALLGVPVGRFQSDEAARTEGLPGQIAPGNMTMALFSRIIRMAFPGMTLRRLSATFRVPVLADHPVTVRGVVTEKHASDEGNFLECDLVLESEEGERWVTGTASVYLPST